MLIGDLNALTAVNRLDFTEHIRLNALDALDLEDVVGVDGALGEGIACFDMIAAVHLALGAEGDEVLFDFTVIIADDRLGLLSVGLDLDGTCDLGDDRKALGLACFEDFDYAGKTLCNILCACNAAGMEGTHGAAMIPTASPMVTSLPVAQLRP